MHNKIPESAISVWELNNAQKFIIDYFGAFNPRAYLEIGARDGGSLYYFAHCLPKGSLIISVDLPNGKWGNEKSFLRLKEVHKRLSDEGYETENIIGDSHSKKIIGKVGNWPIDLLLIDGDHTPEALKKDIDNYTPFVKKGGLVMFHDCGYSKGLHGDHKAGQETMKSVHRVVKDFAAGRKSVIFQETWGLGIVIKGSKERDRL